MRDVKFGDQIVAEDGTKYVVVKRDSRDKVWLYNEDRDMVVGEITPSGNISTFYVKTGDGRVLLSMEESRSEGGHKKEPKARHKMRCKKPDVTGGIDDLAVVIAETATDGGVQRYAAFYASQGISVISPDEFMRIFPDYWKASISLPRDKSPEYYSHLIFDHVSSVQKNETPEKVTPDADPEPEDEAMDEMPNGSGPEPGVTEPAKDTTITIIPTEDETAAAEEQVEKITDKNEGPVIEEQSEEASEAAPVTVGSFVMKRRDIPT